ncbi:MULTISPECIES: COX15/CtaA family protein [Crateriforma]|uniref:Heme A synthase n=1 Tax=Crateriforma conspicua TaxID=2527996 RepID=A0A5C6FPW2_9PLAN|nr:MULTISPECIES: COX15/CtaA family protein [Crateriforma]TWU64929.1 Heme A synthase [Crateriforma conspicua]
MTDSLKQTDPVESTRIVRRLAWLLIALAWPLIWIGGLVTTYDAGMSVPDWPGTYGYNLFLYPVSTWLSGPFDIMVEHGHRLLGSVVGLVAIALLWAAWRKEDRFWFVMLCFAILIAVIAQGVLGGLRVVMSDQVLAMVHGCVGPAFFALAAAAVVGSSRWWRRQASGEISEVEQTRQPGRLTVAVAGVLAVASYGQLVLGAMLRHAQPGASPDGFAALAVAHMLIALGILVFAALLWPLIRGCGDLTLSRLASALVIFVALQIVLGFGTWVVNYGFPSFLRWMPGADGFLVRAKGFVESWIVTGHVAIGSLILALAVSLLLMVLRCRHAEAAVSDRGGAVPVDATKPQTSVAAAV